MTGKVDLWMPLYVNDYDGKTSRLTLAEDGAYMRLIRDYWKNGPPPDDDNRIAIILRVDVREWRKLRPALEHYFQISDGVWRHNRVESELAKARARREVAAQNGRGGGRPKKEKQTQEKPTGFPVGNPDPNPQKSSSPSPLPSEGLNDDVEAGGREIDIWRDRLDEAVTLAGDALDPISPGVRHAGDLRNLCEGPSACEWRDVTEAIQLAAARVRARNGRDRIRSWSWIRDDALKRREARLNPPPQPQLRPAHERPHHASRPSIDQRLDESHAAFAQAVGGYRGGGGDLGPGG